MLYIKAELLWHIVVLPSFPSDNEPTANVRYFDIHDQTDANNLVGEDINWNNIFVTACWLDKDILLVSNLLNYLKIKISDSIMSLQCIYYTVRNRSSAPSELYLPLKTKSCLKRLEIAKHGRVLVLLKADQ